MWVRERASMRKSVRTRVCVCVCVSACVKCMCLYMRACGLVGGGMWPGGGGGGRERACIRVYALQV